VVANAVVEQHQNGEPPKVSRNDSGMPQGGVFSPLLSKYLSAPAEVLVSSTNSVQRSALLERLRDDQYLIDVANLEQPTRKNGAAVSQDVE
jgi:hypothetical protein